MPKKYSVDDEISRVVGTLESTPPESDDYKKIVSNLEILSKVKAAVKGNGFKISGDAVWNGVVMVGTTLLVLYFEKADVVTSKTFGWIGRKLS